MNISDYEHPVGESGYISEGPLRKLHSSLLNKVEVKLFHPEPLPHYEYSYVENTPDAINAFIERLKRTKYQFVSQRTYEETLRQHYYRLTKNRWEE